MAQPYTEAVARFEQFAANFKTTKLWQAMAATKEDSPWHREANVGVHTDMLLRWYMDNLAIHRSDRQRVLTMVACLFHDVGKPPSEIQKHSEERGDYRAYHGHEQVSARIWVDYAVRNFAEVKELLQLDMQDVANISLMIENHVPFDLKKGDKRRALKQAFFSRMGESGHRAWLDLLLSDQHGRISDGQAEKLAAVEQWMHGWSLVDVN